ncbi:MarR family winged helix-turn-helix transcriptional regulator [Pseudarthrobacter sp. H3Y2-7]|uniref:MarR family winged helix-turn-helix transcriptional regulator n=1 Tax=Pseudarthrobacter naphthalenicus TaxID=3031328 RepID=UPI0023B1AB2B|nr:MarR family winged helix-turn-helix transcriptional regulator [Pseudarthrobacter sp. H3Y2-7]MDE8670958.1 MarR family winged helix-turn-helix transcriptional regulator [Pseudarthrobacter sp. H3Y2-7]
MTESTQTRPGTTTAAVPGDLGWHLALVLRGYQTRFEGAVAEMPAGIRGFQVLSAVVHKDPPNQQALGAHLVIDRTVLTYLLDTLVDAGVVQRIPDPADRRARKIIATAAGRRMLAAYEDRVAAAEADLLAGMAEDEARTLGALISQLARAVHRAQPGTSPCEAMDNLV